MVRWSLRYIKERVRLYNLITFVRWKSRFLVSYSLIFIALSHMLILTHVHPHRCVCLYCLNYNCRTQKKTTSSDDLWLFKKGFLNFNIMSTFQNAPVIPPRITNHCWFSVSISIMLTRYWPNSGDPWIFPPS